MPLGSSTCFSFQLFFI